MFLHSGASFHGHEFSNPQPRSNVIPRRYPLARSAFSTPLPRKSPPITIYEDPEPSIHRPARPLSEQLPRKEPVVRFQEVEQDTMSEDGRSVANSEGSETTTGKRRKRSTRTSTTFHLAHPAPTLTQRQRLLQIRPRLLLQLQRLSADSRPKPALDVLPSTVVVSRLAKKFPRMFRGKGELGCNDVMVVKSEDYDTGFESVIEEGDSDEEGLANRDLIAVICQMRKDLGGSQGKAEIVLNDGSVWIATPLPNGLYEFVTVDEGGNKTTARWVRRSTKRRSVDISDPLLFTNDTKFTFSIIDPNSRRHPILASLIQTKLDIPDFYTTVSPSSGKHPPTSPIRSPSGDLDRQSGDEELVRERTTHAIDESLKSLIEVTGIWVALRQGWSPYFKYNDAMVGPNPQPNGSRLRSSSLSPEPLRPIITASSTPESCSSAIGAVIGGRMRRTSGRASPVTVDSPVGDMPPPRRTMSTGTAFMQRAAARRIGNPPSTVQSDSEGESMMSLPHSVSNDISKRLSTPPVLPGSTLTTPETPTKPQRRTQSAYIPTSTLQTAFTNGDVEQNSTVASLESKAGSEPDEKPRISKWRSITNFFRRTKHNTRSTQRFS